MNPVPTVQCNAVPNHAARARLLSRRREPLLVAAWERVLMIHFEVDATALQRDVPYKLDLWEGNRAFVSLVAFTLRGMRPHRGGKLAEWLLRPIATHHFLNVRTYVQHCGEPGIHFLAEWLSNWLAVQLGPITFGLPYRYGRLTYHHHCQNDVLNGMVADIATGSVFAYDARLTEEERSFATCDSGSLTGWLMERYSAFNSARGRRRLFRVWHPPWEQVPVDIASLDLTLLKKCWPWFGDASLLGANYSNGFDEVWMGRPWPVS